MLRAGLSRSCLWQWEVAESCPSVAAAWQPGSSGALSLLHCSEVLRLWLSGGKSAWIMGPDVASGWVSAA